MNFNKAYDRAKFLLAQYGKADKSSYVDDRRILWIGKQPLFTKCQEIAGHQDAYIKAIASEIYPDHDYILIAGGNTEIGMHRDASYAAPESVSVNLGGEAYWEYEGEPKRLAHGDITRFNCKKLHGILEADCDRVVIAIWKKNPSWK